MAVGDFSTRDAIQKSIVHFLKFYVNFRVFLQISTNTASFSLFFKFNIRLKKNLFWDLCPKPILLCVSEGRSQKLNLVTLTPHSLRWKSTNFHDESACPIRKSSILLILLLLANYNLFIALLVISDLIYL